jgi:MerR family transcriptional regulator, heat shock protein HspR
MADEGPHDDGVRRTVTERRTRTMRSDGTTVQTSSTRVEVSSDRGVFMISVAAELAEMHPQTLRMYEARGLIEPQRSAKGTRLYSHRDVERLRRIQEMTADLGMNLAGVERVFELEEQLEATTRRVRALEKRAGQLAKEVERLEALRRELRADIVPYMRGGELVRAADLKGFKIQVQRPPSP